MLRTTESAARVDDDGLRLASSIVDPVVVSFDGQYVWSFSPSRDGVRHLGGRSVPWPETLRPHLVGTTRVRVCDADGSRVHVESDVTFAGSTASLSLRDAHGHPLAVDVAGHLTRVFSETSPETRRHIAEGTARALTDLRERVGVDAHLSYGALLGAVRDGRMIGHDSDSDLAYLSAHTHPADVVRESFRIEREMRLLGWKVVRMSGADLKLFLPLPDGRSVQVDVFGAFHVEGTFYQLGGRSGRLSRESLTPVSTVLLEGVELAAPADPEAVLEFLYGPRWRVPDPSFRPVDPPAGLRRIDGWMRGVRTQVTPWNELFRYRRAELPRRRSSFARWARGRMPAGSTVVELGTGNGRDTELFLRRGHRVIGFDFASTALHQTRRRLGRLPGSADLRVLVLNDARTVLLAGAELAREETPPYLYARELVGCLDAEARGHLWRLCTMSLRRGGALFLEYAEARPDRSRAEGLIERVDTDRLIEEIERTGGRVVHREVGPGQDFLDQPDPSITRLEVRWTPAATPTPGTSRPAGGSMSTQTTADGGPRGLLRRVAQLPEFARDLKDAVHENRRLNRRIAELTDIVAELLVPLADRDEDKARELLARYREGTLAP